MNYWSENKISIDNELGKQILKLCSTFVLVEFHLDKTPFRDNTTGACEVTWLFSWRLSVMYSLPNFHRTFISLSSELFGLTNSEKKSEKCTTSQTIPYDFLLVARQNELVTSIQTDFILSSRIEFEVSLSLIGLKEIIWIFFGPKLIFSMCKKCFHVFDASNLSEDLLHLF